MIEKWTKREKARRNKELIAYSRRYPDNTQEEIGRVFGLDKSRVCRILKYHTCENCYHFKNYLCNCREASDIEPRLNKCRDWISYEL